MERMRLRTIAFLLALLGWVAPVAAEEMQPLRDWVEAGGGARDPAYAPIRCTGLYVAIMSYAGTPMSPQLMNGLVRSATTFTAAAIRLRAGDEGDAETRRDAVLKDTGAAAARYEARMKRNFETSGRPYQSDDLVLDDLAFCRTLTGRLAGVF
jgi:hypothetical protein